MMSELIAVIAAAIAASEGKTSTDGFVVRFPSAKSTAEKIIIIWEDLK